MPYTAGMVNGPSLLIRCSDESLEDSSGRVLLFSVKRFAQDVCEGDRCFICGATREQRQFNDEHILPRWILRKYRLLGQSITLPNGTTHRYDQYKIPCCAECNSAMGMVFENPIQSLVEKGYRAVVEHLKQHGPRLFFDWLSLIYLKTHMKDKRLALYRDERAGTQTIGDFYEWETLHHIHCLARSFYIGAEYSTEVFGSFLVLPAVTGDYEQPFDFGDIYYAKSILLRLGDIAFVAVFNDAGAALSNFYDQLVKIEGPLSVVQLREILANLAYINTSLVERPQFYSVIDSSLKVHIGANMPQELKFDWSARPGYGELLYAACAPFLPDVHPSQREAAERGMKEGKWTFLFDRDGRFLHQPLPEKSLPK